MKKIIITLFVSLMFISSSFATKQINPPPQDRSFYQSVKATWNTFLDALAGKSSRNTQKIADESSHKVQYKKTTTTTTTSTKETPTNEQDNSVYDSIKAGWNSFLDVLVGKSRN